MKDPKNTIPQVLAVLLPLLVVVGLGFNWPAWALCVLLVASGCCLGLVAFLKNRATVTTAGLWIVGLACGVASAFLLQQ